MSMSHWNPEHFSRENVDLAGLFEVLEASKQDLGVEAYSLAQATSLERVFIEMAKSQIVP